MNTLEQLLAKWKAGTISPEETAELKQLLATPAARAELVDDLLLDEAIYHTLRARPGRAPSQTTVSSAFEDQTPSPAVETPAPRRPSVAKPARARRSLLVWHEARISVTWSLGFAAAACLALAGLWCYFQNASVGRLAETRAQVVVERGGRKLAAAGQPLYPGDLVRVPADGAATLAWANEPTQLELGPGAELRLFNPLRGKRLALLAGRLEAEVAPQPLWRAMTITTPEAEAKVVGTHFSISATDTATRLEVLAGAVRLRKTRLTSLDDKKEVLVRAGEIALATPDAKLATQFLTGFLSSDVWAAPSGTALTDAPAKGTPLPPPTAGAGGGNRIERLCGYLLAPVTGDFTFWVASYKGGTPAELWMSPDEDPAHKQRIAYLAPDSARRHGPASTLKVDLNQSPTQHSAPQALVQGRRYYIEVWHEGGIGSLGLAWRLPDEAETAPPRMVDIDALCPFLNATGPGAPTAKPGGLP